VGTTRYETLARREAEHWGGSPHDPRNRQIWDDPVLQEIFFGDLERRFRQRILENGPRVLELGCGEGDLAIELAERGLEVTAIDLSPERIREARRRVGSTGRAPEFLVGDLNTIHLPEGPFDCVIAHDALHHVARLAHVFDEIQRVLRPGGALLAIDYIGMTRPARFLAAALYALLPTSMPYLEKWRLRRRLGSFLASESAKREALERGGEDVLHDASPFEGISQESIVGQVATRFPGARVQTLLPFWWYLAPKLSLPAAWRPWVARWFRRWDDALLPVCRGAYVDIEARR
jgi:ubiquinone/menaquinone biosynthesis C-methylase UbiE